MSGLVGVASIHGFDPPEQFPELPALAERLGVSKLASGERASIVMTMKNGDSYSLFALLNAFLDRVDAATQPLDKFNQKDANQAGS